MSSAAKRGAITGLITGILALGGVLAVVLRCLPLRIAPPAAPGPWYCADPVYGAICSLAFPVNLLTNDLATAIPLAPLSLAVYVLIGMAIGSMLGKARLT
ncbi:MAG: hypothetical protein RMJ55_12755 [Roseiflexaceae bacterium]|nr:hypothetical protein [Roseiflexaceae bacterium]